MLASLFAAAATLSAHAAVFMVPGVPPALGPAGLAGGQTRLKLRAHHLGLGLRLPCENPSGRVADVGTVEIQADAMDDHLHVRLAEAGVGAGRADLGALETGFDALQEGRLVLNLSAARVGLEHSGHGVLAVVMVVSSESGR